MAKAARKYVFRKSPEALVAAFDAALPDDPRVERRKMFGYPAVFVGGNMAAGLFEASVVAKLSDADRARALAEGGAPFEPMKGRIMGAFVTLPESDLANRYRLAKWLALSTAFVATMPSKPGKAVRVAATSKAPKSRTSKTVRASGKAS